MRILIIILLFAGLFKSSFADSVAAPDDRTLTEKLFKGQAGTIFTCKILTVTNPAPQSNRTDTVIAPDGNIMYRLITEPSRGRIIGTATAQIIQVYFGKVDTNIVTLNTTGLYQVDKIYLIYTVGIGSIFSCGVGTKQVAEDVNSIYEIQLLQKFSDIFKNNTTGKFTFKNPKNVIIAEGQFKNGKAVKVWKHYYDDGIIKSGYDLKNNITSQYSPNGFIKTKSSTNKNKKIYTEYSPNVKGQLKSKYIETTNNKGYVMQVFEYYDNGSLKAVSAHSEINTDGIILTEKIGIYEEYYENGKIKLKGQYNHNKRIGLWKWYYENGEFNIEFDYMAGASGL